MRTKKGYINDLETSVFEGGNGRALLAFVYGMMRLEEDDGVREKTSMIKMASPS